MQASETERLSRTRLARCIALSLALLALAGCATPEQPDPWEPMNRGIFAFNETLDVYAIEPVATAWDFVVPGRIQDGIDNFFDHLGLPIVFVNNLLQAKPKAAGWDVLRFVYNTVFGLGGFVDIATMVEMPAHDEDFGQTLGYWGLAPGPFLVLPILGPSTVRDGTGLIVDTTFASYAYFTPFWFQVVGLNGIETFAASVGVKAFELVNLRAIYLEEIAGNRADAFDYYAFVRNAYLQNRSARVADRKDSSTEAMEDLYFYEVYDADEDLDEDEDEDEDEEDYDDL